MNNECSIVRDLLPLYAEQLASKDTVQFVEQHLAGCEACRHELELMRTEEPRAGADAALPLKDLKRKLLRKQTATIVLTLLFAAALCLSAFAALSAPRYFPYSPETVTVEKQADGSVCAVFGEQVTDYSCYYITGGENGQRICFIEAWDSTLSASLKGFAPQRPRTIVLDEQGEAPDSVYYVQNNGEEDVCIYGEGVDAAGIVTLPRLALGYYVLMAATLLAVLLLLRFVLRRKGNAALWLDRLIPLPAAYLLGHLCVKGFTTLSYSMLRDFLLIVFAALLIYGALLLLGRVLRLKKELKELN